MARGLQLALTLVATGALLWYIDLHALRETFSSANPWILLGAWLLFVADRVLMAYKWTLLLKPHSIDLRVPRAWALYSAATLYGSFLPSTVGADALRILHLVRQRADVVAVSSTVVVERVIGFGIGILVASLSVLSVFRLVPSQARNQVLLAIASVGAVTVFALVAAGLLLGAHRKGLSSSGWVGRLNGLVERTRLALRVYRFRLPMLGFFSALTLGEQLLTLFMSYLLAFALRVDVGAIEFMAAMSIGMLISRLPLTVDGIGLLEGTVAGVLVLSDVAPAQAVAVMLLVRVMSIAAFLPGTAVHLLIGGSEIRRPVEPGPGLLSSDGTRRQP